MRIISRAASPDEEVVTHPGFGPLTRDNLQVWRRSGARCFTLVCQAARASPCNM
jgi:hypothetical protein